MSDSEFELDFSEDETEQQQLVENQHNKSKAERDEETANLALATVQAGLRLNSIRDSSQRYLCLRRLDEINLFALGLLKEQLGLNLLEVASVMGSFNLDVKIELEKLIRVVPNATLIRRSRSVLGIELRQPAVTFGVTANGYVSVMGAKNISDVYLASRRLACIVHTHLNPRAKVTRFSIGNIVLHMEYPDSVDLAVLENELRKAQLVCHKPPSFSCLQCNFTNDNLPLVQPIVDLSVLNGKVSAGDGTGESTLTGSSNRDNNNNTTNQTTTTTTTAATTNAIKDEVKSESKSEMVDGESQTTEIKNEGGHKQQHSDHIDVHSANILQHPDQTFYPPDLNYSHSAKVFGSGAVIIMGVKSFGMGVVAVKIWHQLVKKYNIKRQYTTAERYGEFVSRSVNIADVNQAAMRDPSQKRTHTTSRSNQSRYAEEEDDWSSSDDDDDDE